MDCLEVVILMNGLQKGLHQKVINLENLASGAYKIVITNNNDIIEQTIEKF